jgi:hypothetical protein
MAQALSSYLDRPNDRPENDETSYRSRFQAKFQRTGRESKKAQILLILNHLFFGSRFSSR